MGGQQVSSSFASPHRNAPTSGGRTPTTPHAPGRAGPWCTRAAQPPGVAVAWVGLTAAGHCSSPHAGEPRSLHVSSGGPVGADRGPAAPRDDPRCDPPSHLVDHRERPGATGSGPRGIRMARSNPQPESVGPARGGASADSPAGFGNGCRSVLLGQLRDDGGVRGIDRLAHLVVRDRATDAQRVPSRSAYVRHHARVPRVSR